MADSALELSAEVVELSLVEGERRTAPPEMGFIEGDRGRFYVLVEVSAPAELWDTASERLVEIATEAFHNARGGVTKALNAAADAANHLLLYENENALPDQRIWAGLNGAVLRGADLYLGQAGPALTYLVRDGSVKRFPQSFDDLQTGARPVLTPLGEGEEIQVRLAHSSLKPNDLIILTASHLPTLAHTEEIEAALTAGTAQDVAAALAELASGQDFSALVIRVGDQLGRPRTAPAPVPRIRSTTGSRQAPLGPAPVDRERDAWWYDDSTTPAEDGFPAPTPEEEPPPQPTRRTRATRAQETGANRARERTRAERAAPTSHTERYPAPTSARRIDRAAGQALTPSGSLDGLVAAGRTGVSVTMAALLTLLRTANRGLSWSRRTLGPQVRRLGPVLDRAGVALMRASAAAWEMLRALWYQMLPSAEPAPAGPRTSRARTTRRASAAEGRNIWVTLAVLLPLLVLVLTAFLVWQQDRGVDSEFTVHASAAAEYLDQAESASGAEAAALVRQAEAEIEAAEAIQPDSVELHQMRQRAQTVLDQAFGITRPVPTRLAAMSESAQPINLARSGDDLYVLDAQEGAVYRLSATEPIEGALNTVSPIMFGGQQVGDGTLGKPQFLTWMPEGNGRESPALIVLTASGQIVEYDPATGEVTILPFAPVDARVVAIEPYEGNLYLLDREHTQIWKYVPSGDGGYSNPASSWILPETSSELAPLLQMAIDGDIYVLQDGGKVTRLNSGKIREFSLPPLEPPLSGLAVIATEPPESTDLFLADGEQVFRLSKQGQVLARYLPPVNESWGTIRDIAVDSDDGVLYLLTTGGVYRLPYGQPTPTPTASPEATPEASTE